MYNESCSSNGDCDNCGCGDMNISEQLDRLMRINALKDTLDTECEALTAEFQSMVDRAFKQADDAAYMAADLEADELAEWPKFNLTVTPEGDIDLSAMPPAWAARAIAASFHECLRDANNWSALEIGPMDHEGTKLVVTVRRLEADTPEETVGKLRAAITKLLDCAELNYDDLEPETVETIGNAALLLEGEPTANPGPVDESEVTWLTDELMDCGKRVEGLCRSNDELREELRKARETADSLMNGNAKLRMELNEAQTTAGDLFDDKLALQKELAETRACLETARSERDFAQMVESASDKECDGLRIKLRDAMKSRNRAVEYKNAMAEERNQANSRVLELQARLESAANANEELRTNLELAEKQRWSFRSALERESIENEELGGKLVEKLNEIAELKAKLDIKANENEELTKWLMERINECAELKAESEKFKRSVVSRARLAAR